MNISSISPLSYSVFKYNTNISKNYKTGTYHVYPKQGLNSIGSMGAPLPGRVPFAMKVGLILKEIKTYLM